MDLTSTTQILMRATQPDGFDGNLVAQEQEEYDDNPNIAF